MQHSRELIVTISRRLFVATAGSLGVLTLAACSSDPVKKAESAATPDVAITPASATGSDTLTTASASTSSSSVELYDGSPVPPLSSDPLLNPKGVKDRPLGGKNAKVIIVEYSSPTCSHCASFANDVFPEFRKLYIDTGKVTFILRPLVRNVFDAVVFLLADAAGSENYVDVVDTYFRTVMGWATSDKPRDAIEKIALQLGFTQESFEAALTNQTLFDGLDQLRTQALEEFDVTGTPTFFINGQMFTGGTSLDQIAARIDPLLA